MDNILDPKIDNLLEVLEEGARASNNIVQVFVEPVEGTLRRAKTKRHQMIFGRRGSGKSSLILKSYEDLISIGTPSVYVDLEPFKTQSYPNIIICVMLTVAAKLERYCGEKAEETNGIISKYPWLEPIGRIFQRNKKYRAVQKNLVGLILELNELLFKGEELKITLNSSRRKNKIRSHKFKGALHKLLSSGTDIEANINNSLESTTSKTESVEFIRTKSQYLTNGILSFRTILGQVSDVASRPVYVYFDDLYHIQRDEQPKLIDYFHRLLKGNNGFLKIGTIKTRSNWYNHVPQPIGMKIGDDADEINLDQTLESFASTRDFLKSVLKRYNQKANGTDSIDFISETGLDRLVLASGGVARDFLGLFRMSISHGRERLKRKKDHHRGKKLSAEDVNVAAGAYGDTKRDEFQKDTFEDTKKLEDAFNKVKIFCLEVIKKNIFLVDQDTDGNGMQLLNELIDLRLIHQIKQRVTVTDKPGIVNRAYLLDLSQYAGERARKDVARIDFWKDSNKDKIRLKTMIYDPNWDLEYVNSLVKGSLPQALGRNRKGQFVQKQKQNPSKPDSDNLEENQLGLFD